MIINTVALILFVVLVGVTLLGGRLRRLHGPDKTQREFDCVFSRAGIGLKSNIRLAHRR